VVTAGGVFDYDAELRRYVEPLRAAAGVGPDDRVLDIGCGAGQTTRDAARAAVSGSAHGVDLSEPMLSRARRLSAEAGLRNVTFELADAQTHPFPSSHYDLAISRFGTMFFADPVAAFANLGRALRDSARLVMLVWQDGGHQEWWTAVHRSLAPGREVPTATGPFSLADRSAAAHILATAGFAETRFAEVHEPIYSGPDQAAAIDQLLLLSLPKDLLAPLDTAERERALDRLRTTLAAHDTGAGIWFDARAWIITARRRTPRA
jgi:ubiquinone/menaquinone biosynthesis C-methylase UbiE